nr:MAG TPA: dUTPase [Caudoviricetes sp.]
MMKIQIKLIEGGRLPEFKTDGAVCADCYSRCKNPIEIKPNSRALIPLGFAVELPKGYEMVLRPRSGMSKNGIDSVIGTIDFDYRGEVMACVINNIDKAISVENGTRICQCAIRQIPEIEFEVVSELSETVRGNNGFGSTGS